MIFKLFFRMCVVRMFDYNLRVLLDVIFHCLNLFLLDMSFIFRTRSIFMV